MLTRRDFESGQNKVIGIHSGICSSDDYMKCMRRAAIAYSQIDACYIHWNDRSGIAMKYNHSGITLNGFMDLKQRECRDRTLYQKDDAGRFVQRTMTRVHRPKDQSALQTPIKQGYNPRHLPTNTRTATTNQTAAILGHHFNRLTINEYRMAQQYVVVSHSVNEQLSLTLVIWMY